jgi:hypothetical protein
LGHIAPLSDGFSCLILTRQLTDGRVKLRLGSLLPRPSLCYKRRMSAQLESTEAAILNRVIQPESGDWPRAAAETILGIGFDPKDLELMSLLLEKAQSGSLSTEEAEVLENYRHIGKLLELMKSRAPFVAKHGSVEDGWSKSDVGSRDPSTCGWTLEVLPLSRSRKGIALSH